LWQVDEARKLVYFVGLRETPLERHLYVAPYAPPRPPSALLLTAVGGSCTVHIDPVLIHTCTSNRIYIVNIFTRIHTVSCGVRGKIK
jgi:hypothetical protein